MLTNVRYILLTALRDRLFLGVIFGVVVASMIASVLGGTAMVESVQMQLSYAAASSRMIIAVGVIVFVCFHIRHAFEAREIDVFLSRPISRASLVISYAFGFIVVSTLLVIPTLSMVLISGGLYHWKISLLWGLSLLLEQWLVVVLALFAAFTLRSAVSAVLAALGFYVLSRMIGFFVMTSASGMLFHIPWLNEMLRNILKWVSILVPRLDFFAKTEWLIYDFQSQEIMLFIIQAAIFVPLLLAAAIYDFRKRQF